MPGPWPVWPGSSHLGRAAGPCPCLLTSGRLGCVTHRAPSARTVIAKINAELDAALQAAEAEPSAAEQGRRKIRAIVAALKSAWKQA